MGALTLGVSRVVQAKVSPYLCFAQDNPSRAMKQSEMTATCVGLGDSRAKSSCVSRLAAARRTH